MIESVSTVKYKTYCCYLLKRIFKRIVVHVWEKSCSLIKRLKNVFRFNLSLIYCFFIDQRALCNKIMIQSYVCYVFFEMYF